MKNKTTKRVLDLNQNKIMKNSRNLFQMGVIMLFVIALVVGLTGCESRRHPITIAKNTPENTQTASQDQTKTPTLSSTPAQMQQPTQELGIGSEMINPKDNAEMVYVPAGEFMMGSDDSDAGADESPAHKVNVDAFWMYKHEVTNAQFADFLNSEGNQVESGMNWLNEWDSDARIHQSEGAWIPDVGFANHPVVEVSWYGAAAYCQWVGGRLPTEAEWEKAARGADGRTYPWGNDDVTCTKANYCDKNCPGDWADSHQDDGYSGTAPVGSFPDGVSPHGVLDMAGNVEEWVVDWYDENYYSQSSNIDNPQGPTSGNLRVLRGGNWFNGVRLLRTSTRNRYYPDSAQFNIGFRCVFDEETQPEETITESLKNEVDGAELVLVPRGMFLMGSEDSDAKLNEAPQHMVFMDSFWVYKHEVTNAQFAAFLSAEGNEMEGDVTWLDVDGVDVHIHQSEEQWVPDASYEEHPVVHVSWFGAAAYCQWAGGHLPTEAEWEKAARGADGRTYPWGYDAITGAKANYCDKNCPKDRADMNQDDGYSLTAPVGSFPDGASHYGALDLAGNVWEWVADWYDGDYYSQPGNTDNPQGPPDGDYKIMRGGSWDREENLLRSSYRGVGSPDGSYFNTGFRCVLDQNN